MTVTMKVEGLEDLSRQMRKASDETHKAVDRILMKTAIGLRSDVLRMMYRFPARGKLYVRTSPSGNVVKHRASQAGDPPAVDTGRLANSASWDVSSKPLQVTIGSKLAYAAHLEYGTRKMGARPVWRPMLEKTTPKLKRDLEAAIGRALK